MTALGLLSFRDLLPAWALAAWFVLAAVFPVLLLLAVALRRRGKVRRPLKLLPVPAAQLPRDLSRFAQPWIGRLGFLGFQASQPFRPGEDENPEATIWLMSNIRDRSVALLAGILPANGGRPGFSLRLMTFLADGRVVVTADHPVTHRRPAHWSLELRDFPTIESQIQAHRRHAEAVAGETSVVPLGGDGLATRVMAEEAALDQALLNSGDYRRCGEHLLRPALSRLPAMAWRDLCHLTGGLRANSFRKKDVATVRTGAALEDDDIAPAEGGFKMSIAQLVEQDIRRYRQHADQPPGFKPTLFRLALLGATLFAFTATFGREQPAQTAFMLLGLIAVHEFGHWLMMRAFGYQRMGRFFVPFIGPVDRGRKLHAPAWQQFAVILAGPLPGLFTGMGVLVAGFFVPDLPLWLLDLGGLAVVLNAFYLLPFLPLDGGKVVDLLIFRDLPFIRPIFTVVSAAATLVASLLLKSRPLRFIAIGMFAGLAWDIRMIKVVRGGRRLGWAGQVEDENEALHKIFHGVREEKNEAFLRSHDWQRQMDVLLSEVLRKKPRFVIRFFGGAIYWAACMLPIAAVIGAVALLVFGDLMRLSQHAVTAQEFSEEFPRESQLPGEQQAAALEDLVDATQPFLPESATTVLPVEARKTAASMATADLSQPLDRLDWKTAGIATRLERIDAPVLSLWLEILCGRMEKASSTSPAEAARRAEVLLHAIQSLEPSPTHAHRLAVWEAELRTLEVVDRLAATGRLDGATLQRFDARLNALNRAPLPEVENLLLVSGYSIAHLEPMIVSSPGGENPAGLPDARFWRHVHAPIRQLLAQAPFNSTSPATVALARHWKQTRHVAEIPQEFGKEVSCPRSEAEFIARFCESHRRSQWRRMTTQSALRLETYRQQAHRFPPEWRHLLPGGASLTLIEEGGPYLELSESPRTSPAWLGLSGQTAVSYRCPLHGAPLELSRK